MTVADLERPEGDTGFRLTPRQQEALELCAGPQRHTMLVGGARSAKTFFFVRQTCIRAIASPHSRHAVFRFRANAVWASIGKDTLPKVMRICFPGVPWKEHRQDGYFTVGSEQSQIWLAGLDEKERIEKILGLEFATLFFNECSQIPYNSVTTALTRLAQVCKRADGTDLPQRAFYDLNPTTKAHWTNQLFIVGRDPISKQPLSEEERADYRHMFINPMDNAQNLSTKFLDSMAKLPARQRKRFFDGKYGDDTEGALWSGDIIEAGRKQPNQLPDMQSIVVAVDPSGARNQDDIGHDAIGIVVFGLGVDGHGYLLEDLTCLDGPSGWGKRAITAFHRYRADHITAEINYGGAMVEYVIKSLDPQVPVRMVTASRGKVVRAEPVSALYGEFEDGTFRAIRIHHVGGPGQFSELEDELSAFTTAGYIGQGSPNRADALVWAVTDLMLDDQASAWIKHYADMAESQPAQATADPMPWRTTPAAPPSNELTDLYQRTFDRLTTNTVVCARPGCGLPIKPGEPTISDGERKWHVGCHS